MSDKFYEYLVASACVRAIKAMQKAHVGVSGFRVGAAVIAENHTRTAMGIFDGCNIELASSRGFHAESVALTKAISDGYPYIHCMIVTGTDDRHQAAMCGYCMQDLLYATRNKDRELDPEIIVVKSNSEIKLRVLLSERNGQYGYFGLGKLQI